MSQALMTIAALRTTATVFLCAVAAAPALAQDRMDPVLAPGQITDLPVVRPNDNCVPAGVDVDGVREIELEVVRGDWRLETPSGPGLSGYGGRRSRCGVGDGGRVEDAWARMTVLMRQAGLRVQGLFGPAKEEWAQYGMEVSSV